MFGCGKALSLLETGGGLGGSSMGYMENLLYQLFMSLMSAFNNYPAHACTSRGYVIKCWCPFIYNVHVI